MPPVVSALLALLGSLWRSRRALHLQVLALQHQVAVYKRTVHRPHLSPTDRIFWSWLSRLWAGWQDALAFVHPHTVMAWQHQRLRDHWRRLSQRGKPGCCPNLDCSAKGCKALGRQMRTLPKPGRPAIAKEVCELIREMGWANPTWGSPRIVGELRKLGIEVAKSTVETYRVRPRKPPSPTWKAFLNHHVKDLVSLDFFVVPTVTSKVLFVLVLLAHERRGIVHLNITEHPTAAWTAQQVVETFPWDDAPRYLLRDRDSVYGAHFRQRVWHMGIDEVRIAPRSPWQNPYVERVIGSIRREVLAQVIVLSEPHLTRLLTAYVSYYHRFRTHLSLAIDCPYPRPVSPPERGGVMAVPEVGGLHHHDERQQAA